MSTQVRITAVGALVKGEDSDRYRPLIRGARVVVSDEDAARMVADGTAEIIDGSVAANAEAEQPDAGAFDLDALTVKELHRFADTRRIDLGGARLKPEIIEAIEGALTDPETED